MKQLRCPKCGHEFAYDNGYYDRNIERLGQEIREITLQLAEHNRLPYWEKKARTDWWRRAKAALAERQKEIGELKAIRKAADQQLNAAKFLIFRELVKDKLGEAEYTRLLKKADEELDAYQVSGLMKHEYSRAHGQSVANINRL